MAAMCAYFASTAQTLSGWSGVPVASTSKGGCSRQSVSMGVAQDGLRTTREVCHASQQLQREKTSACSRLGIPRNARVHVKRHADCGDKAEQLGSVWSLHVSFQSLMFRSFKMSAVQGLWLQMSFMECRFKPFRVFGFWIQGAGFRRRCSCATLWP